MVNATATAARKPAAAKATAPAKLSLSDKLAAATSGLAYPAADNGAAWLALAASLPAVADAVTDSRGGKYKENKGLIPGAGDMLSLSPHGITDAATGRGKNGKPNCHATTCMAVAKACAALQTDKVCKAAAVFFGITDAACLASWHGTKACDGNGKATGARYIGRDTAPCPNWLAGYINGNVRQGTVRRG